MNANFGKNKNQPYVSIREKIEKRKNDEKKKEAVKFSDFLIDVKRNPMILIGLGGSALFTSLMGLFIGLAPKLDENANLILFGGKLSAASIAIGIFFGLLYAVAFPVLGEWGVYYWHRKASLRDLDNKTQMFVGYGMMFVAGAFTVTTAIAAAVILASLLHTFQAFQAIPEWAQKWTVLIIPIALAMHAGANIWYDHVSKYAEERREMERELQTKKIEAENRIRQARINAEEIAATAMADEYVRISSAEAATAGRNLAGRTWSQDKERLGADRDDDGLPDVIDPEPDRPSMTMATRPAPVRQPQPVPIPAMKGFGDNGNHEDPTPR